MTSRIMCPVCARKGVRSWLASADGIKGEGFLFFWCKKCKKEIKIDVRDIQVFSIKSKGKD